MCEALTGRVSSDVDQDDMIEKLYEKIFQRRPTENEKDLGGKFLSAGGNPSERLERYVHTLLISNEFAFVE